MIEEYKNIAVKFSEALSKQNFASAVSFVSSECSDDLAYEFKEMISYGDGPVTNIELMTSMEDWPDKKHGDVGWAYVSMSGSGFNEAVAVIVCEKEDGLKIREIEWGRP